MQDEERLEKPTGTALDTPEMPAEAPDFDTVSEELAQILDEKAARQRRKQRISSLVTLFIFGGAALAGVNWFRSDPNRLAAAKACISDIRSIGDVTGLVGNYKASLDKIASHNDEVAAATSKLGIDPNSDSGEDPNFDEEMREMTGPDGGPTVGERSAKLREKFGGGN